MLKTNLFNQWLNACLTGLSLKQQLQQQQQQLQYNLVVVF